MRLSDAVVGAAVAVTDMARARQFYEGSLGLSGDDQEEDGGVTYECGSGTKLHVFPSPSASPSGATLAGWAVDDLDATVEELMASGVAFEQYGEPFNTDEHGIARTPGGNVCWFKDPDGNVLSIVEPE